MVKIRISLLLIIAALLVFAHHFLVHGYVYDSGNLFSHEAGAMFLAGAGVTAGVLKR